MHTTGKKPKSAARAAWGMAGLVLVAMFGCSQPAGLDPRGAKGWLAVQIIGGTSRSVLSDVESEFLANTYELLVVPDSGSLITAELGAGEHIVGLEPGTYELVVLAGVRRSSGSSTALLLGSGVAAQPVTIVSGERSSASIQISPISLSFSTPESAPWGSTIQVEASGSTGNDKVGMPLSGDSTTLRPRLKSVQLWDGYEEFDLVSGNENSWSAELAVSVPNGIAAFDLQLFGAVVSLTNLGDQSGPLTDRTNYTWRWPNRLDLADDSPLVARVERWVEGTAPETGLDVTIGWN